MAIVRNIEVIAQSPNGFDDACREAIREASKTLRGISSFWIKNADVIVETGIRQIPGPFWGNCPPY